LFGVYRRILVGTDGSATAAIAVDRAVEVAAASGAELTIASVGSGSRPEEAVRKEAARHAGAGVTISTRTVSGDPASALANLAEEGFDLLVVGNKGMTGASRFFLGSVPNKISHHAPCALLIVRTT
jgi:nucleotide-binding universal stress UspA family protein